MTRTAAFDCGTNSLRLLIADIDEDGTMTEVDRRMRIVRLGQGVDRTGAFHPDALQRTFAVCEEYADLIAQHAPERQRFVATSASRDVSNRDAFVDGVRARLGLEPEVIDGEEEARLSFLGATAGVPDAAAPQLVMDLGGGSTELILGKAGTDSAYSMNIGCVRLFERHLAEDPPTAAQIAALRADVDDAFSEAAQHVDVSAARTLVGVAGTITTVAAATLDLDRYDRDRIHGASLSPAQIAQTAQRLVAMPSAQRAELPYMHPPAASSSPGWSSSSTTPSPARAGDWTSG